MKSRRRGDRIVDASLSASGLSSTIDEIGATSLRRSRAVSASAPRNSEAALIARLKRGDSDAADEFFDVYAARIRRFIASALGRSDADADDVLQDTMIALAEALPFFRGDCSLFTFACAIAHRKVLTAFRASARRARLTQAASTMQLDSNQRESQDYSDVQRGLARLTPEYREILTLKYVEEISVAEIARILAMSEHAIESRLARARKALRKSLEESR
jgi:RNA polymerase sigma-70 factor (ECF subfamily)